MLANHLKNGSVGRTAEDVIITDEPKERTARNGYDENGHSCKLMGPVG